MRGFLFALKLLKSSALKLMPFASNAQRRKFYAMAERGEFSKSKVQEYKKNTKGDIPDKTKHTEAHKEELLARSRKRASEKNEKEYERGRARSAKKKALKVMRKSRA